ncbi:hypothetical protein BaRGS_00014454 [Batillaria attramentaria]|uniref:Uncharacterized protein n=1 Tax=Batillaria attramentaria TaxID=370345 RepID=A0ABD0L4B0_9CAEN
MIGSLGTHGVQQRNHHKTEGVREGTQLLVGCGHKMAKLQAVDQKQSPVASKALRFTPLVKIESYTKSLLSHSVDLKPASLSKEN